MPDDETLDQPPSTPPPAQPVAAYLLTPEQLDLLVSAIATAVAQQVTQQVTAALVARLDALWTRQAEAAARDARSSWRVAEHPQA